MASAFFCVVLTEKNFRAGHQEMIPHSVKRSWLSQVNCCYVKDTGWVVIRFFRLDVSKADLGWRNGPDGWTGSYVCESCSTWLCSDMFFTACRTYGTSPQSHFCFYIMSGETGRKCQYAQKNTVWLRMMKLFVTIKTKVACSFFSIAVCACVTTVHCLCIVRWDWKWSRLSRQFRRVKINPVLL